jgi:hypothetical protein
LKEGKERFGKAASEFLLLPDGAAKYPLAKYPKNLQ